jgi:hypothetical protein
VEDMCYESRRAEACVYFRPVWTSLVVCHALMHQISVCVCLLLQCRLQTCSRGGRGIVEDMCYERRRAEACVDLTAHHALVNAGETEIV